jgi:agmatine deiminase
MTIDAKATPRDLGYRFPAEWERHAATWLSYPHNETSWPGKIQSVFPWYHRFIQILARGELVNINVNGEEMKARVCRELTEAGADMQNVMFHLLPTNDAWCRDHGPAFILNPAQEKSKAIVNWKYNGWGNKYPSELDTTVPARIGEILGMPVFHPGIVMEGGSVEFNGRGTLLTTTSCLLHPNRNPHLNQQQIENYLVEYYGVEQVLWLGEGIEGDDTDGHIDDLTRFVNEDSVVTVLEHRKSDENYLPLRKNLAKLGKFRLMNGKQLNIIELPMPEPRFYKGQRLPVSYANFYIANAGVIVPTYRCKQDDRALSILENCFRDRPVIGLDSVEIIWGLGSWHCLSQQEPLVTTVNGNQVR